MANNIKTLYKFTVPYSKEVEEVEVSHDGNGNEIKTTRKVKKEFPRWVCLKRATRAEMDNAMLYYSVRVHEGMKAGMISKVLLGKVYENDGGVFSRPEQETQDQLWVKYYQRDGEFKRLSAKVDKIPEDHVRMEEIVKEMMSLRRRLQEFEMMQTSVYDISAESRARTMTIIWWLLNLTYLDADYEKNATREGGPNFDWQPMFPGDTFDKKQAVRDAIEDGDNLTPEDKDFYFRVSQKAAAATAFWHYGRATTQAEFEALESEFNKEFVEETEVPETDQNDSEPATETEPELSPAPEVTVPKKRGPKPKA